ncbi:MAG TPA: MFS transporter [Chloroflexota bacterium]|nr:MFS transporter [Chloroflexota bacterium]
MATRFPRLGRFLPKLFAQNSRPAVLRAPGSQRAEGPASPPTAPTAGLLAICGSFGRRCRDAAGHVLITPNYALFMGGSFLSAMGSWFLGVAIGWVVLEITNSPFYLGVAGFARLMPVFFLGLFGGALSDRVDRRKMLLAGIGTNVVVVSALAVLTVLGWNSLWLMLGLLLIFGVSNAFVQPAWQPFIKELVPADRLRDAVAFNSARFNVSRVLGPALAGVLLASVGAGICLVIAAVGMAGVLVATWFIRRDPPANLGHDRASRSMLGAIGEGFQYVRRDLFVGRLLLITGTFGLLVMPYQSFMPAFARDILGIGASGLGSLLAAVGVGAIAGALLSSTSFVSSRPGICMAVAALLTGVALASFATSPAVPNGLPWRAYLSLVFVGLGATGYLTTSNATLQLRVPEHLVGRVMGLWVVMNAGMLPLGGLMLGWASVRFGLPSVIFWCGLVGMGLGVLALVTRAFTGSRDTGEFSNAPPPAASERGVDAAAETNGEGRIQGKTRSVAA